MEGFRIVTVKVLVSESDEFMLSDIKEYPALYSEELDNDTVTSETVEKVALKLERDVVPTDEWNIEVVIRQMIQKGELSPLSDIAIERLAVMLEEELN